MTSKEYVDKTMESFRMEFMMPEHLDQVLGIEKVSFPDPWSREMFLNELKNPAAVYFVVLNQDDRVVAYSGMWKVLDEGHIMNIAVDPAYRGIGIGDSLLENMINYANANKIKYLTLEVRESNIPAIRLYTKHGFREYGIRKGYYQDNNENAIIMWRV